jgi:ferric-dicitrate binding protein FerR (iron transport regulator)
MMQMTERRWPSVPLSRRRMVGGALGLVAAAKTTTVLGQNVGIGHVLSLRGEAFVEVGPTRRPLAVQAPLHLGDLIVTGPEARIRVRLGRRTILALGENARLRIDRQVLADDSGDYELQAGPLLLEHDEKGPSVRATVRSSYGLIAVRGTRFFAGPSNNVFGVFVASGRVSVQGGGRTVLLDMGEGTNIRFPGDRPSDPVPWGESRIRAALASVE